jgi:F-type H+-transporting ATPase subunit alpha
MKKVSGTLKLDQAQYRELEAFSKFGSDLDAATKSVLDKGIRNVEVLKQDLFSTLSVEKQIAIVYLSSNNLLKNIPVNKIRAFQAEFFEVLEKSHADVLASLRTKPIDEVAPSVVEIANKVMKNYEG